MTTFRVGLNPLPWVLTPTGFDLSVPILNTAFAEIATTRSAASTPIPRPGSTPPATARSSPSTDSNPPPATSPPTSST